MTDFSFDGGRGCGRSDAHAVLHTWPFPAFSAPLRTYIDLSDFVGLLWFRDRSPMQVCGFCRTAGSRHEARCAVCGTAHMPAVSSFTASEASTAAPGSANQGPSAVPLIPIVLVMGRMLIVPFLLFIAFCVWHALHHESQTSDALQAHSTSQAANANAEATVEAQRLLANLAPLVLSHLQAKERGWDDTTSRPRAASASPVPANTRRSTAFKSSGGEDELLFCAARNVLMRAVCMNNICASPYQARRPQCAAAVVQRHLDEERRNPVMAN